VSSEHCHGNGGQPTGLCSLGGAFYHSPTLCLRAWPVLDLELLPTERDVRPPSWLPADLCTSGVLSGCLEQVQGPFSEWWSCSEAWVGFPIRVCARACIHIRRGHATWHPVFSAAAPLEPSSKAPAIFHLHCFLLRQPRLVAPPLPRVNHDARFETNPSLLTFHPQRFKQCWPRIGTEGWVQI